jgi:hypothetical protein
MLRFGLRHRGRATTQRSLGCHRGIVACTWYRAAVVRALVQVLYKHLGAIFYGGRGDTRARATENLFQPLLLPPFFASCLVEYLETEIQNIVQPAMPPVINSFDVLMNRPVDLLPSPDLSQDEGQSPGATSGVDLRHAPRARQQEAARVDAAFPQCRAQQIGGRASRATRAVGGVGNSAPRPRGDTRLHGRVQILPGPAEQCAKRPQPVWSAGSPACYRPGGRDIRVVTDDAVRIAIAQGRAPPPRLVRGGRPQQFCVRLAVEEVFVHHQRATAVPVPRGAESVRKLKGHEVVRVRVGPLHVCAFRVPQSRATTTNRGSHVRRQRQVTLYHLSPVPGADWRRERRASQESVPRRFNTRHR